MDINTITMIGRLGKKPEIKQIGKSKVATFSIASNDVYKDRKGNKVENVDWIEVQAWGRLAEIAKHYLDKGKRISIVGRLKTSQWEDIDGNKRSKSFVRATTFQLLSKSAGGADVPSFSTDDVPF